MQIRVQAEVLDPWMEVQQYQQSQAELAGKHGAATIFVGSMRDFNQDAEVAKMTLEHYPGMTEKHLQAVAIEAMDRWQLLDVLLLHRVGELHPNDPIVLVAVWSAHRAAAFDACRYIIDELKTRAPFWKQEQTSGGARWVKQEKG